MSERGVVFDLNFVWPEEVELKEIRKYLDKVFKKWAGQGEIGSNALKRHYQIRGSLFGQKTKGGGIKLLRDAANKYLPAITESTFDASITCAKVAEEWRTGGIATYVAKYDTGIEGTQMASTDARPLYVPWQYRQDIPGEELGTGDTMVYRPWQQSVIDTVGRERRTINCIVDPEGCKGKSTLVGIAACTGMKIIQLPPLNDWEKLMAATLGMLAKYEDGETPMFFVADIPRAMNWDKLKAFCTALESLKEGYAFDPRYKMTERRFDSPALWAFANTEPDASVFTPDRWVFWSIKDGALVKRVKRKRESEIEEELEEVPFQMPFIDGQD